MSGEAIELLDLIARWTHVIAGIMWVGNSLLFNWLDRSLRPRADAEVYGDIWLLHSGGFYLVEKNKGERTTDGGLRLPNPLHWFKWQAYTTWLTGAALLLIVYYVGGRALLVDASVANIPHGTGTLIAVGTIVVSWLAYELIWRTIGNGAPRLAAMISAALLLAGIWLLASHLSARAAYLHVGALLGTLMAANVAFTIVPSQRELVAALSAGREPSQHIADRAKHRSIHNNYFTFPVIALMLSAHFPSLYSRGGILPLLTLIVGGAAVRHVLNVRFTYRPWKWMLAATMAGTVGLLALQLGLGRANGRVPSGVSATGAVSFDDVRSIVDRRCASCHSREPSDVTLGITPAGIAFDTPAQIQTLAARIRERAVITRTMPPGNKTRMTDAERAILARWVDSEAQRQRQ
jgi:uncharacterized membrane protein